MNSYSVPPRGNLLWLAVDFDGTLAEAAPGPDENGVWPIGEPITGNIEKARDAIRRGWKVVIHTSRPWAEYEMVEQWMNIHDVPFNKIVCGKLLAVRYIDDRGISPDAECWYPET